jgi:hypothetical protein
VSATFGLMPRFPVELGQRKGESRSISAEGLLSEPGSPSLLPPVLSGLLSGWHERAQAAARAVPAGAIGIAFRRHSFT